METFLLLILLVIAGFLFVLFINQKLLKKIPYSTTIEFFVVGILISEPFIDLINQEFHLSLPILLNNESSIQIKPIIATILGAIGFSVGLNFRIKELFNFSLEHFKLSITNLLLTFLILGGVSFLVIISFFKNFISFEEILLASMIIGIASSTLSSSIIESIKDKFNTNGKNFQTLYLLSKPNNFLSISILGLIFTLTLRGSIYGINITPVEWFILTTFIGFLLGFLFFFFIEGEKEKSKLIVSILGIIIFSSGSAYFINTSPLFLNALVGFVIGNFLKSRDVLVDLFKKIEQPFYIIILIYSGALIKIDNFLIFICGVIIYLILRYLIKYFSGWFAYQISYDRDKFNYSIGKGLNSQGIIAIAIMVNFQQVFHNPITNSIFSIIVFSIIINEILAAKLIKDLLIDLNEIR